MNSTTTSFAASAESARTIGFLHPIAVRKVQIKKRSKLRTEIVLVAGAYRLEAARYLGHERIECKFVYYDDDPSVQSVQIQSYFSKAFERFFVGPNC